MSISTSYSINSAFVKENELRKFPKLVLLQVQIYTNAILSFHILQKKFGLGLAYTKLLIIWFASSKSEQKSSFYFERWLRFIDFKLLKLAAPIHDLIDNVNFGSF